MKKYGFEIPYLERCLDANMHNYTTTTYYLLFKKSNKAVSKHATNPCPSTRNNETFSNRKFIIDDLSDDSFMFPDKTITSQNEADSKLVF